MIRTEGGQIIENRSQDALNSVAHAAEYVSNLVAVLTGAEVGLLSARDRSFTRSLKVGVVGLAASVVLRTIASACDFSVDAINRRNHLN